MQTFAISAILLIGILLFPLTISIYLVKDRTVGGGAFLSFLRESNDLAVGFTDGLIAEYKAIVFAPNLVGVFAELLLTLSDFTGLLKIPVDLIVQVLFFHLTLIVVSSAGLGLLQMAKQTVILAVLGEAALSWAFFSGNLFLIYMLLLLWGTGLPIFFAIMGSIVLLFMGFVLYFSTRDSAKEYVRGAVRWKANQERIE